MRRISGVATAAVLALTAVGIQSGGSQAATERPNAIQALLAHPGAALASRGTAFTITHTVTDADGSTHVRMDRTYRGLPVLGGDLVVHRGAQEGWRGVSQTLEDEVHVATTPVVGKPAAADRALAPARATRGIAGARAATERLVVDATSGAPRLAWEVLTGGTQRDGTPSRLATYVDARTGAVIRREQQIQTVDGSGQSLYSGTVPLQLTLSGSTYQLKDPTRGNTYTTDMGNASDSLGCQYFGFNCKTGTLFTSPDNLFGNGSTSSRESAAVDAQYGTNMTWDFYKSTYGRNGIFGTGAGSFNRVHYGKNYVNAFWDGTKMTYGDGDGTSYGPLVSLDVAGHEMSHGVTENTAGLNYSGESGGLNESTSDIFGTMVEFYAANANDPGDYLIGEEFDLKNHLGFRRMDNPASDGSSFNCWSSTVGTADVHYSSGVGNHFFYLLAEGSGAKTIGGVAHNSPTCNGSTVTGIGRDAASAIWYRALTVYMTSSTSYSGARTATLNAARDLYGAGSAQQNAVAAAWSAVSVN
ncbi:M4 family metallopeptidase [Nocardioides sp.]|uniref:M4 family metallopeptidase n=1 Tax=Nocardioides sp. TaxID=35761 RepID=UPI00260965A0|nr:M4 family metallopeptidase [Nocardioides sp.]MDI6908991.1 M4 family metallopeptidase [Nocardioides sp.]